MGKLLSSWDWRAQVAALLAAIVVIVSAISALVNGVETVRDVFGWMIWAWERLNTPWLGLFMLVWVGWLLWRGLKDMAAAAERGNEKDRKAASRENEIRQAALEDVFRRLHPQLSFIEDLKRLAGDECVLNELERFFAQGEQHLREAEAFVESLPTVKFGGPYGTLRTEPFDIAWDAFSLHSAVFGQIDQIPRFSPLPAPVGKQLKDGGSVHAMQYDTERNQHYEDALKQRLTILRDGRDKLKTIIDRKRESQGRILRRIGYQHATLP